MSLTSSTRLLGSMHSLMNRPSETSSAKRSAQCKPAAPLRAVRLGRSDVIVDRRPDGTTYLRSPEPLGPYPDKLTERLEHWAAHAPARVFLAERDELGGWRTITYAETLRRVRVIGSALLPRNLSPERPIVILSGNDIEHALLGLAAIYVGIPYAPVSPAYSLLSTDFGKLRHIISLLTPALLFAADGERFAKAIEAAAPSDVEIVVTRNPLTHRPTTLFSDLLRVPATPTVDAAHAKIGPETIAKFLFTSGSTGLPKAVINTQRMWCSNQEMLRNALAYFEDEPPVVVDWAPWHHTAGGNHNVGLVLYNGGSLYIDEGKPTPEAVAATVRNLREIAPTWYFNVPKGYEALLPYLRDDPALRENFFRSLKVLWYAGASIAQHVLDEMQELAVRTCGERILFLTSLGATETAPFAIARLWDTDQATNIGLPPPGLELKLVPTEGKLEARLRGPNITPGYWCEPALTANAFDAEGFYKLGDALKFVDADEPSRGLLFDGRIAEDFKLSTGTWVNVGPLRATLIDRCAPYARDAVIAGPDRSDVTALIFPDIEVCRSLAGDLPADATAGAVLGDFRVRAKFRILLEELARESTGSSNRVARALLLEEPPSLDAGEMTDKGSINQRAVLSRRAGLIEEVYADPPPAYVITIMCGATSIRSEYAD